MTMLDRFLIVVAVPLAIVDAVLVTYAIQSGAFG